MRKFTFLLLMLLCVVGAKAAQDVIWKGNVSTLSYANNLQLDNTFFANVSAGDYLCIKWTLDETAAEEYRIAHSEEYRFYEVKFAFPYGSWDDVLLTSTNVSNISSTYVTELSSAQVTKLKEYGLALQGHCVKYNDISIGSNYTTGSEIQYWDNDASTWKSSSTDNFTLPTGWGNRKLKGEILANANIGDRIKVEFKETQPSLWDSQLEFIDNSSSWTKMNGYPIGGLTYLYYYIDENNITAIKAGEIYLNGKDATITNIKLESCTRYYLLDPSNTNTSVSYLPSTAPINVKLTRKIDWNTTICVPFDVDNPYTAFGHEGAFYSLKEYNSGLVFTPASTLEAGKPYYATFNMDGISEVDKTMTFSFDDVTINTTLTPSAEVSGLTMKGNYTSGMSMTDKYGVACVNHSGSWDWAFYKGGTGTTLNAFSAYVEGTISGARLDIVIDDEATGVNEVRSKMSEVRGEYFNLNGQRIAQPTKGLYIVNGKKVVIK